MYYYNSLSYSTVYTVIQIRILFPKCNMSVYIIYIQFNPIIYINLTWAILHDDQSA